MKQENKEKRKPLNTAGFESIICVNRSTRK